jgi:hypothetical protein
VTVEVSGVSYREEVRRGACIYTRVTCYDLRESRAIALGDTQAGLHFNLGVLAEQRGDGALAAREYRLEVALHPDA